MLQLADVYLGTCGRAASGVLTPADIAALDRSLAALCVRGHAAYPHIALEDTVFVAHLGSCGAPVDFAGADVHAEDLFLCCAGLLGDEAAVRTLRDEMRPVVVRYLQRIDASPAFVEEIEQRLWQAALVESADGPPKLASYAGKGPVAGWLGFVAQRIALTIRNGEPDTRSGRRA